jgi:hypothetical protein
VGVHPDAKHRFERRPDGGVGQGQRLPDEPAGIHEHERGKNHRFEKQSDPNRRGEPPVTAGVHEHENHPECRNRPADGDPDLLPEQL